ncbi:MAG: ABC transporter ATP-binding protein [Rubrobacteraceae bacterium]
MRPAVSLRDISKRYKIFPSQKERLKDLLGLGKTSGHEFWALRDIDLDVNPGTVLGILGRNGAGKSTLLKVVSGVLMPTSGSVEVNGRLVALLQLGAGFDPDFTGRENVMLNGLILGLERREMLERFDEIEAFADIGEFMDQPTKTYSSGMKARLGFAVAVNVEPDVLIVDETLSVGDAVFRAAGLQKMNELRDSGATILFVSHSPGMVRDFCNEGILLHKGALICQGDVSEATDAYQSIISNASKKKNKAGERDESATIEGPSLEDKDRRPGTGEARVRAVEVLEDGAPPSGKVAPDSELTLRVSVEYGKDLADGIVGITLRNDLGTDVFSTNTDLEGNPLREGRAGEEVVVDFSFRPALKHGQYGVAAFVSRRDRKPHVDFVGAAATFKVSRPAGGAFEGLVHLPTGVSVSGDEDPERRSSG